ncbi:MAG: cholest-4-en-3-one 26-monooxygenase [Mycobacterium sp.]|jgi:cholest-4-en-3-one 26-monooxygenase|nr:cholest-4-en-3-one 26-monooxygenase [Mycobacterium sp.]
MDGSSINLLDRDVFMNEVPHQWFSWLRDNAPVYRHREPEGPGFWVISKHEDVVAVNRNSSVFSSDQRLGGVIGLEESLTNFEVASGSELDNASELPKLILTMDPPDHTRYRKLVNKGFTPRMIDRLEPRLRAVATEIVDAAVAKGSIDFVVDVAAEFPLVVIAEMLGVPHQDRTKLFHWSNQLLSGDDDPEYAVSEQETMSAQIQMFMYAQQLAEQRRGAPRDDIVSTLLSADIDGTTLSELDFNMFFVGLAVAGNETTRNAIAQGMNAFLQNPEQYKLLVEDPSLITSATEEILRWATPAMYFRRTVTEDTEIRGQHIAAGDKVSIWYISANRDEDQFHRPFDFDITRSPNNHVSFGGGGPHFCIGAILARMEIRLIFEELIKRAPSITALEPPVRLRSNFINGLKHLKMQLAEH